MSAKSHVLVTGGNRGIGLAIVERFAREDHPVLLTARDKVAGEMLVMKGASMRRSPS